MSAFFVNVTSGINSPSIAYRNTGAFVEFFQAFGYDDPGWYNIAFFRQFEEVAVTAEDAAKLREISERILALSNRNLRRVYEVDHVYEVRWLASFFVKVKAGDKIKWYP